MRKLKSPYNYILIVMGVVISLFHLYTSRWGVYTPFIQRGVHLTFLLPLVFLLYPATAKSPKDRPTLLDGLMFVLAMLPSLYVGFFGRAYIETRIELVTKLKTIEIVLGVIMIICVLEAVRRSVSPIMAGLIIVSLSYLVLGPYLPGALHHQGMKFTRVIESVFLTAGEGVYGGLTGISATYVAIFILFGSFIAVVGTGEYFTNLSRAIAGSARGGPAKIATISSALMGTISGSAVANVYGTGTFTIPLMKKLGFSPDFAGAVEAVASTGGQLMPPVMGAAAFIVAESLGIPYVQLAMHALIPAILYYVSLYFMIDLECARKGIAGEPKESLPKLNQVLRDSYLFLPIIALFYLMLSGKSASYSAFMAIIVTIVISFFNRKTWMTPRKIIEALVDGAKNTAMIATAMAGSSIIVVALTYSGLGLSLTSLVLSLAGSSTLLLLILVAIMAIVLGMGVPTAPAYVIASALGAPMLLRAGFSPVASHLFILYYAVMSNVTPPVAIASFAGANIAGADPMRTGVTAARLAAIVYAVPFIFVYQPVLLGIGSTSSIILAFATALIGTYSMACAVQGWFGGRAPSWLRLLLAAAGLLMIYPGAISDVIGLGLLAFAFVYRTISKRATNTPVTP